jgi:integrase
MRPGVHVIKDEYYWLPLLAAFTGARLEELGQLHVSDIRESEGGRYFSINEDEPTKHVKNADSIRDIPIHPELVRLGFLHYVDAIRTNSGKRVFPNLEIDSRGSLHSGVLARLESEVSSHGGYRQAEGISLISSCVQGRGTLRPRREGSSGSVARPRRA